jgi:hypothetical protein
MGQQDGQVLVPALLLVDLKQYIEGSVVLVFKQG